VLHFYFSVNNDTLSSTLSIHLNTLPTTTPLNLLRMSAPDLGRHLAAVFALETPCGCDRPLVNRGLAINPNWASNPTQAASGWEVVRQEAGTGQLG